MPDCPQRCGPKSVVRDFVRFIYTLIRQLPELTQLPECGQDLAILSTRLLAPLDLINRLTDVLSRVKKIFNSFICGIFGQLNRFIRVADTASIQALVDYPKEALQL